MRSLFSILLVSVLSNAVSAQEFVDRNSVYIELGGNGLLLSVNYDRRVSDRFLARAGFSSITGEKEGGDEVTILVPLMVGYLTHPHANHHIEAGAGVTFITGDAQDFGSYDDDEQISRAFATGTIGYRYQKPGGGFVFRAGLTPLLVEGDLLPWVGFSFGGSW